MFAHWDLVVLDFQTLYHLDLGDRALRRSRTWGWFSLRVYGLLTHGDNNGLVSTESRLQRVLRPSTPPTPST